MHGFQNKISQKYKFFHINTNLLYLSYSEERRENFVFEAVISAQLFSIINPGFLYSHFRSRVHNFYKLSLQLIIQFNKMIEEI